MLERAGFHLDEVIPVAGLPLPVGGPSVARSRMNRYRHFLARPDLAWHQLRFKRALRRHRHIFDSLEGYLIFARKED